MGVATPPLAGGELSLAVLTPFAAVAADGYSVGEFEDEDAVIVYVRADKTFRGCHPYSVMFTKWCRVDLPCPNSRLFFFVQTLLMICKV